MDQNESKTSSTTDEESDHLSVNEEEMTEEERPPLGQQRKASFSPSEIKVLVVDSEPVSRRLVAQQLKKASFQGKSIKISNGDIVCFK